MGSHGSLTLDDTDECCRIHDKCYKRIDGGLFGCWPKLVTYDWEKRSNRGIVCTDRIDTCDRNACDCDKAAADCFERHRSTHDSALLTLDDSTKSAICNL
jgi:secretory phospholipase A2